LLCQATIRTTLGSRPHAGPPGSRDRALKREILISGNTRETRVAILEDDRLVELLVDRPDTHRSVGDIYLGKVEGVLPGIQAAFVNIGAEKSAFLHASDLIESDDEDEGGNGNGHGDDDEDIPGDVSNGVAVGNRERRARRRGDEEPEGDEE